MEGGDSEKAGASGGLILLRAFAQFAFSMAIWGGLLFWAAGTLWWSRAWIHLGLWVVTLGANLVILLRLNPAALLARMKARRPTEKFDKIIMYSLVPVTLAIPAVAGLDAVRCQWSRLATWAIYPGIVLHAAGDAFLLWAMVVNPYGEKTVRIQTERGHRVVTTGPYALVRHPMYVGVMVLLAGIPLVLGSWWTFLPMGVMALAMVIRTAFEDRMLRRELPGYDDYARRTRYRLLPGLW